VKRKAKPRRELYVCLECGWKLYSIKSAEKAASAGCPSCGGMDTAWEFVLPFWLLGDKYPTHEQKCMNPERYGFKD